jgi:flavin-dependent dehydrogenase
LAVVEEYEVGEDFIINNYGEERTSHFHLKPNNFYGYAWTFPKESTLNIGFGAYWKDMKRANIKEVFSKYLALLKQEKIVPDNIKVGRPKGGLIPLRGSIERSYSDHILILGDAAGFVSPIGGDGIYYGMCSGRIASEVAEYAVEHDSFGKDDLKEYQRDWYQEWGKDLEVLCYLADKVSERVEQIMKYGSKDEKFKEMAAGLYNGECKPSKMKWRILRRMARDFLLYDIFKRGSILKA